MIIVQIIDKIIDVLCFIIGRLIMGLIIKRHFSYVM